MDFINQSAFLKALGWSLLDSLWQMGLMWLVYVCLTANGKKYQARQRHTIALLSLTGGTVWFFVTLVINFYRAAAAPEIVTIYASEQLSGQSLMARVATFLEPALPYLSVAYLVVAAFLFIRFYRHYFHIRQLYTTGIQKAHPEWRVFLQQALQHMGIKKKVTIWFSSLVDTPLTVGFWKPVILLPVAAVNHLSIQQAEAIILHELNHIRRNDYLINLLIACTDIILFFNPFSRFLSNIVRKEREHSCDDFVLQFRYDAAAYAKALLTLEQNRGLATSSLTLAATGKNQHLLLNRVKRILTKENTSAPLPQRMIAFLLSALVIGFIGLYNPGRIITRTIDDVRAPLLAGSEMPFHFTTPASETAEVNKDLDLADSGNEQENAAEVEVVADDALANVVELKLKEADEEIAEALQASSLIELATEVKLAAIAEKLHEIPQMASFANVWQNVEFTFQEAPAPEKPVEAKTKVFPFVPSSSFSYHIIEDTSLPKKYVMTYTEKKTKEAVEKALLALQAIDWKKLETELSEGEVKVDITKLQQQLKKALKEVDWKKIDEETQAALLDDEDLLKKYDAFRVRLGAYQAERARKQAEMKKAEQMVLLDRLTQHAQLKKAEEEKKKEESQQKSENNSGNKVKKKKIVHI